MMKSKILAIVGGATLGGFILPLGFTMAYRAVACACPTGAQLATFAAMAATVSFVATIGVRT